MEETLARKGNPRLTACEVLSSGECNLQCSYCYIPKNESMKKLHKQLVKSLKDNTYIGLIKKVYGEELSHLGLWGTEPTLIIQHLKPHMKDYLDNFPKLREIGFSSNFVDGTHRILDLVDHLSVITDRKINIRFQASLDGQEELNDADRGKGVTKKIVANIEQMLERLERTKSDNVSIEFSLKPTLSIENITKMIEDSEVFLDWFRFFNSVGSKMRKSLNNIKDIQVTLHTMPTPTLVVPGKYTVEDGKKLGIFFKMLNAFGRDVENGYTNILDIKMETVNQYVFRLMDMMYNYDRVVEDTASMTCSGIDSQAGIDITESIMPCHRMFLFNDKEYIETAINDSQDWDISKFERGIVENIQKYLMPSINKPKDVARYMYLGRSYHDFAQFRYGSTVVMIKELAMANQVSKVYLKNDNLALLLAQFLHTKMSCPAENYLNTGSLHLVPVSLIRLFGNGAFEEMFKEFMYLEEKKCRT